MRVWPGLPYPLGRDVGWSRRQLRALLRSTPPRSSCACSTLVGPPRDPAASRCPSRPTRSGTAIFPTCSPASSTATACTARTNPRTAIASIRNKVLLDPYAQADRPRTLELERRPVRLQDRRQPSATSRSTIATAPPTPRSAVVVDTAFTWGDDRRSGRPGTTRSSTSCTSRVSRS